MKSLLLVLLAIIFAIDEVWHLTAGFALTAALQYAFAVLAVPCWIGSLFYTFVRKDPAPAALLFALGYLPMLAFYASVFTYFAMSLNNYRIDDQLAAIDRAIGFDWVGTMRWASTHPAFTNAIGVPYLYSIFQIPALVAIPGFANRADVILKTCLATTLACFITIFFWAAFPSFGAFSVYTLPSDVAQNLHVALDANYGKLLVVMLHHAPGDTTTHSMKGLVGFPSFHAALSLVAVCYLRYWRALFVPALIFNAMAIVATPIQGGHHIVDVIAGAIVTAFSIFATKHIYNFVSAPKPVAAMNSIAQARAA